MTLPPFDAAGLLPVGDYPLTLDQLRASYLVTGHGLGSSTWDAAWRRQLVDNLEVLAEQLWRAGVSRLFINGSFAEAADRPGDIDGYFECELMRFRRLCRRLNTQDPRRLWDWSNRTIEPATGAPHPSMWHVYRVELFPHFTDYPQLCGVPDRHGNDQYFPSAFRHTRIGHKPKGIILIVR